MMKHVYKKIVVVICSIVFLFGSMFEPFTCAGFRPVRSFVVHAEEDPGTTTATHTGIAALIALLMASGIRFVGDYETVVQPAVTQLWEDFSTYAGNQLTLAELGAGIAITQGYMRVSSSVNNAVAGFQSWYQNTFNVPNTGDVTISVGGTGTYYDYSPNNWFNVVSGSGTNWYFLANSASRIVCLNAQGYDRYNTVFAFFENNALATYSPNSPSGNIGSTDTITYQGVTYHYAQLNSNTSQANINVPIAQVQYGYHQTPSIAITYAFGADASIGDISMEGQSYELKDGYQLDNDQAKLLDIAGLAALAAALGLALENVTDLVNDIPLIYGYPWAQDFPDVYADTPADTIPWVDTPTSVIPADTPEYVPTTPSDTDSYKVLGLERVFPFSIPFDLYYLIQAFSATPETPHFTIGMYNPASRRMVTQEINLQQFESYAQIFRVFVTAMYILALILITRRLIRS